LIFVFWGGLYPNTFLKPMEASIGAARMMAINPSGQRPSWKDESHEIDPEMNLVANGKVIAPANLHYPLKSAEPTAAKLGTSPLLTAAAPAEGTSPQ